MDKPRRPVDFPENIPISESELALIETYFGATIAALTEETPHAEQQQPTQSR